MALNMNKIILFIQGGGEGGYRADQELVASLQKALGKGYEVKYPEIKSDETEPDFGWTRQIGRKITETKGSIILAGHSFGASMILKYLSENSIDSRIEGVFLIATPFWDGDEDWQRGLKLQKDFAENFPDGVPIFFYHCKDDEEVPLSHMNKYKQKLNRAAFRVINNGGHQLNNDLTIVAKDIKSFAGK